MTAVLLVLAVWLAIQIPLGIAVGRRLAGLPLTPLSSRRHTDAGTPRTVTRRPRKATASARSSSSTRPTTGTAGQGPRP